MNRSGRFTSSSENLPASAALNNINAQSWQATKIPYVVTGSIKSVAGDSYEVHYQLYDVEKQTYLLNELLTVPASRIRQAGHMISDAIYQALTGIPVILVAVLLMYCAIRQPQNSVILYRSLTLMVNSRVLSFLHVTRFSLQPGHQMQKLAYVSFETKRPAIYVQDLATGQREVLASFRGLNGAPSFSPDGQSMLFTASMHGNPEVYQMDLNTRQLKRMTNDSAIDTEARYAPDGKSFIFTSDRGGSAQIYRYSFADGSVKRLTFKGAFNARGTLSADGKKSHWYTAQPEATTKLPFRILLLALPTFLPQPV